MRVLVATSRTADDRKTLAAVRALGMSGARVTVGADHALCVPAFSRFCTARLLYPDPATDVDRFVAAVIAHLQREPHDVLLPLDDYTTMAVSRQASSLASYVTLAVPPYAKLNEAHDKLALVGVGRRAGVVLPETHAAAGPEDAAAAADRIGYPCVVKLRRGAGGVGFAVVASREQIRARCAHPGPPRDVVFDDRLLVQEYVPGKTHDACLLFNRGEPRAAFTQRRVHTYPAGGGIGTFVESTDERDVRDAGIAVLRALEWHGPAMVELKRDSRDGSLKLIEINGRFWGSLACAIQAGIDFPRLACEMAVRGDVPPVFHYRAGVAYRWPLPYALRAFTGPEGSWRALWDLTRPACGVYSDLWASDPLPLAMALVAAARSA